MNFLTPSGTWDRIQSPRFLDFNAGIPEAKDSFFERKVDDSPFSKEQRNAHNPKLPFDDEWILTKTTHSTEKLQITPPTPIYLVTPKWESCSGPEVITSTPATHVENENSSLKMAWSKVPEIKNDNESRKVLQAENGVRKFRANPIPSYLKKLSNKKFQGNTCTNTMAVERKKPRENTHVPSSAPFRPISPKKVSRPRPFVLHSELRARERKLYEDYIKEKQRLEEEKKQLMEASMRKREEWEIKMLRKSLVPKAQPIRKYKGVPSLTPKRKLTEPITPMVLKRRRFF